MTRHFSLLLLLALLMPSALSPQAPTVANNAELTTADQLYKSGKFAEAAGKYQAVLQADPKLIAAQVGLIRSWLREQKLDEAYLAASNDLASQPNSAPLLAVMGDVQFRRGEMGEAERSYQKATGIDPKQVQAHLGLARLYRSYSLYRHAYDELQTAHQIAPDDPEVQRRWFAQLPRKERVAAIEAYLAGPHPDDPEETQRLERTLEFLKATADKPVHACKLVNRVEQTDTKLASMYRDPRHVIAYGLTVKLNDHNQRLMLDTGSSGIMLGRKAAEKAGLTRISQMNYYGIGNKGVQNGYYAVADRIRIGELEFQDCVVGVSDRNSLVDEDGLIGADVFSSYLVDIDLSDQKLRLSPLPKRPTDTATPENSLNTEGESPSNPEDKSQTDEDSKAAGADEKTASSAPPARRLPQDRYVAPDMDKWTPIFRFGHMLLIPTHVNSSPSMLFLIDTGSNVNLLSQRAANQVTKTSADPYSHVKGLSGTVDKVYRANKATLIFGHLAQKNQDVVTLDMSHLSQGIGTEVSGVLGFETLHMLQVKIDYRDGLVDFVYDTKRWGVGQ